MTDDYTVKTLAKRLRVCEEMPRRWLRDGRLFAEKRNGRYYIPAPDAQLFIEAYERTRRRGKALAAEPPTNTRGNYRTSKVSRATTTQGLYVALDPAVLVALDAMRLRQDAALSRSVLINGILKKALKVAS